MRSSCELAKYVQNEIMYLFEKPDAIRRLGVVYERVLDDMPKEKEKDIDHAHSILELGIQRVLEKMAWDLHQKPKATIESVGIPTLLDLCIEGAKKQYLMLNAPYKILEDLMDCQTIVVCEKLWGLLESRRNSLTNSDFIQAGKTNKASLSLLRMCNALLRRLSKTHNTVFCGRILMFLAFTFSLSERSAVNLNGRYNLSNVTTFQSQDEFKISMENASLEEASSTDYSLYKVFWDIQRYLRNPNAAIETDSEWNNLFKELDQVLTAFESNPFSPEDIARSRDLQTQTSTPDDKDHFFQTKYLTNSRLFYLQLRDPVLRECMLTQFLILFCHLQRSKIPTGASKTVLDDVHERVLRLLEKNLNGEGFSKLLTYVLERERNFVLWKLEKCPVYERRPFESTDDSTDAPPPKRLNTGKAPMIMEGIFKDDDLLKTICGPGRATSVLLKQYIQRFEEAWDPENGIEKAYWPDQDKMHCWRTMRGCMRTNVVHMDKAVDGTPAIVRGILGQPDVPSIELAAEASPPFSPERPEDDKEDEKEDEKMPSKEDSEPSTSPRNNNVLEDGEV
ncbi:THO complex subunit [Thraustotheca clavata]|uniref:THO complex subunit n=1 Tax=Thraustotheca clavata TaxID=74557 RepID=A0A1V9ZSV5_9STRA|nr:THO complex subunit [Thraustotheca clavata]